MLKYKNFEFFLNSKKYVRKFSRIYGRLFENGSTKQKSTAQIAIVRHFFKTMNCSKQVYP
jgi:hypothetical protein